MILPTWIPKVGRPFNPDYAETWEVMDDNAKRWSWLFDAAVVVVMIGVLLVFSRLSPHHLLPVDRGSLPTIAS
jgi:hypothetical protein